MKNFTISELPDFYDSAPDGYYYEIEEFKRDVISIWICSRITFVYNNNKLSKSIWGFFNQKTGKYYSPMNAKTIGKEVDIQLTRKWSAMPVKQSILESCFS